ncbi:MAG: hypothetical protein KDE19_04420, partial [Caldilineaceae bacterium]|nr:hypothetical protein [Caldilineaceae bacterium]
MLCSRQASQCRPTVLFLAGIAVVTLLACMCLDVQPLSAQDAELEAAHQRANWLANYWNNMDLAGTPTVVRSESVLNYEWGTGSPAAGIAPDHFSARWVCTVQMSAGQYRFRTTSDDGIRVFLDDRLIINEWSEHAAQVNTAELYLVDGQHVIRVEFFEKEGEALVSLTWYRSGDHDRDWPRDGDWRGEYFNNRYLSGSPLFV